VSNKYPVNAPCPCGSGKKYKRCCGSPVATVSTLAAKGTVPGEIVPSLIAYTDETGNTGQNLFDENQPFFWTGTLVSENDMQTAAAGLHRWCLAEVGQTELHGNELGLGGIQKIASKLLMFFRSTGCRFYFTIVEKQHLAGTKFVDTILDSGSNPAIDLLHYGARALRMPLALQFIQVLDQRDLRDFWSSFERADGPSFRALLERVNDRLKQWHAEGVYDARTVQLLTDALNWGLHDPDSLLERGRHPLDSPNVVAFTLIVDMFHNLFEETGRTVKTFIHDEQNQFAKYLMQSYEVLKGFAFEPSDISPLPDVKKMPTFSCQLQIASSATTIGLQFVDVTLWLMKRVLSGQTRVSGDSAKLAEWVMHNGFISRFTREGMIREVFRIFRELNKRDLSADELKRAQDLKAQFEEQRQTRFREALAGQDSQPRTLN